MKKFKSLVIVDDTGIEEFVMKALEQTAEKITCYAESPSGTEELIERMRDAEAVLLSWRTTLSEETLAQCPNLRYIGLCCTYFDDKSCNVDISACRERDVTITGVNHYGDYGVVEYVFSELIRMVKGLGSIAFYPEQRELRRMKLGIIGLGTVGAMIADAGAFFGMDAAYFNRRKKTDCPYPYMEKAELLEKSEVIVPCVPRNQSVMEREDFAHLGAHKIFVNVGVGGSFEQSAFAEWISGGG